MEIHGVIVLFSPRGSLAGNLVQSMSVLMWWGLCVVVCSMNWLGYGESMLRRDIHSYRIELVLARASSYTSGPPTCLAPLVCNISISASPPSCDAAGWGNQKMLPLCCLSFALIKIVSKVNIFYFYISQCPVFFMATLNGLKHRLYSFYGLSHSIFL